MFHLRAKSKILFFSPPIKITLLSQTMEGESREFLHLIDLI